MISPAESPVRVYPSTPRSSREARDFVAGALRRAAASESAVDDMSLIVSELVANSVQHGDGGDIVVRVDPHSSEWYAVTVCNGLGAQRPPVDPAAWTVAPADERSGRGLGIVRQLADEIEVTLDADRLDITCRRRR
ncbi:MAG: ATP-binding protein [Actinobacteria bacterium]|nr:ATP-binding protein [Actinomycetota bacterium]